MEVPFQGVVEAGEAPKELPLASAVTYGEQQVHPSASEGEVVAVVHPWARRSAREGAARSERSQEEMLSTCLPQPTMVEAAP